jgi:hypothetical protein
MDISVIYIRPEQFGKKGGYFEKSHMCGKQGGNLEIMPLFLKVTIQSLLIPLEKKVKSGISSPHLPSISR